MIQPTNLNLINFHCSCCQTLLTVPESMAGVSGPCPQCGTTVTAPFPGLPVNAPMLSDLPPVLAEPAGATVSAPLVNVPQPLSSAPAATVPAKASGSRIWLFAGLGIAVLGGCFALQQFKQRTGTTETTAQSSVPEPVISGDPKMQAIERSSSLVKKFLSTPDWASARSMVFDQDVTGSGSEPAFKPDQFQEFAKSAKFTPIKVDEKENAGLFQIVWQVTREDQAEQLVLTVDDTANGPKVRWYQPPFIVAAVGGTNSTKKPEAVNVPSTAPTASPTITPAQPTTPEETILAATKNPTLPSNGSSALLNPKIEKATDAASTASAASPKK